MSAYSHEDSRRSFITEWRLLYSPWYSPSVVFIVEFTDEFRAWYEGTLEVPEQESVTHVVEMLEDAGPNLRFPYSSGISGSKFGHMRELRIQHEGRPYRVLYAFDPRRAALLLLGGDKTGDSRWYETVVPKADAIYERHLYEIKHQRRS